MKYKVAVVQMMIKESNKEKNLERALELLERAAQEGAKVVCFPDYFLTDTPTMDHTVDDIRKLAEPIPGPVTNKFSEKARELNSYVVAGSIIEKGEDDKLYSTSPFIDSNGKLIGKVRKSHPENAPAKRELDRGITPGPGDYPVFNTKIGKIGIMIDMDAVAVEVPRILGLKGAELIFWPVNFSAKFTGGIRMRSQFCSASEHAYVATAARAGWHKNVPIHDWAFFGETRRDLMFGGGSGIAFDGTYLAAVPDFSEGIAVATIDTELPNKVRRQSWDVMPLLRRPETYGILVKKQKPF